VSQNTPDVVLFVHTFAKLIKVTDATYKLQASAEKQDTTGKRVSETTPDVVMFVHTFAKFIKVTDATNKLQASAEKQDTTGKRVSQNTPDVVLLVVHNAEKNAPPVSK